MSEDEMSTLSTPERKYKIKDVAGEKSYTSSIKSQSKSSIGAMSNQRTKLYSKDTFIERWEACMEKQEKVMERLTENLVAFQMNVRELAIIQNNVNQNFEIHKPLLNSTIRDQDLDAIQSNTHDNDTTQQNTLDDSRQTFRDSRRSLDSNNSYSKFNIDRSASSIRNQLYRLKMTNRETVTDFCGRFDAIIREYESCDTTIPLSEEEKRSAFYQAVSDVNQELTSANLIKRQLTQSEMNLDEIKSFLLQMEEEIRYSDGRRSEMRVNVPARGPRTQTSDKCFRCNKIGHRAANCPLVEYRLWFCFYCQAVKNHKGDECPNKDHPKDGYVKSKTFNKNNVHSTKNNRDYRSNNGRGMGGGNTSSDFRVRGDSFKKSVKPQTPGRNQRQFEKFNKSRAMFADSESNMEDKYY